MLVNVSGTAFILQFLYDTEASENELRHFAKTHNLELIDSDIQGLTISDDPKPDPKDVNRFLKVLKESGHWVNDIMRIEDSDIPVLCVFHKELFLA